MKHLALAILFLVSFSPAFSQNPTTPMKSYLLQYFKPSPQSDPRTRPDVIRRPGGKLLDLINGGANKERGWMPILQIKRPFAISSFVIVDGPISTK